MQRIVFHGDSLTQGDDLEPGYRWPALVGNRLRVDAVNSGIGGDTTGGMLARFYPDVVRRSPAVVLIMGGTNDLWWNLDPAAIQANLFAMACQAQYHGIAPVMGLPIPLCVEKACAQDMLPPAAGFDHCVRQLALLVNGVKAAAELSDIPCLDFQPLFRKASGAVRPDLFLEDGLHPNREGHRLMAREAAACLQRLFDFGSLLSNNGRERFPRHGL